MFLTDNMRSDKTDSHCKKQLVTFLKSKSAALKLTLRVNYYWKF